MAKLAPASYTTKEYEDDPVINLELESNPECALLDITAALEYLFSVSTSTSVTLLVVGLIVSNSKDFVEGITTSVNCVLEAMLEPTVAKHFLL